MIQPVSAIRKDEYATALRTTNSNEKAVAVRAKLLVDVGIGFFRANN